MPYFTFATHLIQRRAPYYTSTTPLLNRELHDYCTNTSDSAIRIRKVRDLAVFEKFLSRLELVLHAAQGIYYTYTKLSSYDACSRAAVNVKHPAGYTYGRTAHHLPAATIKRHSARGKRGTTSRF